MEKILELDAINKSFGGIHALKNVSLEVRKGEVLAIVGENGAGKSTMMKIIAGVLKPDSGSMRMLGETIRHKSPFDATKRGISIVFQEPNIFPELSVLENIYLGVTIKKKGGVCDWKTMHEKAVKALEKVGLGKEILSKRMQDLSIGTQQLVLIARGINLDSKLLILDEPTSILSHKESEKLFSIMRDLKKEGISILYISHRISEILTESDRLVVLRDGCVTQTMDTKDATEAKLIAAMTGRELDMKVYYEREINYDKPVLETRNLSLNRRYHNVSIKVHPGQIVGIYGLVGAGRSEVAWSIFGEMKPDSGKILFEGKPVTDLTTQKAVDMGIFYLPEDRGSQGIFRLMDIRENMTAPFLKEITSKGIIIDRKKEEKKVEDQIHRYKIKTASQKSPITSLSGGNQQKVVFCRWLLDQPKLLILDEPTRGIDVGSKTELHNYILDLAKQGVAILLISSDLPEIMAISDQILTMRNGEITCSMTREEMSEQKILQYSLGMNA